MPSKKPTQPPPSDFATMEQAWLDQVRKDDGSPYQVFGNKTLTRWKQWVGGEHEFDGTGLRDTVAANAIYLDTVKGDLDDHRAADLARHQIVNQRLAALEAAVQSPPFPG
jgi:hypothetical protein